MKKAQYKCVIKVPQIKHFSKFKALSCPQVCVCVTKVRLTCKKTAGSVSKVLVLRNSDLSTFQSLLSNKSSKRHSINA